MAVTIFGRFPLGLGWVRGGLDRKRFRWGSGLGGGFSMAIGLRPTHTATVSATTRIKDLPASERPRERLVALGAESLSHAELIAILLRTGTKGRSAVAIADQLLARFGRLEQLARVALDEIRQVPGIGRDKAVALKAAFTLAQRMARELQGESPLLDTPERVADLMREDSRRYEVERFQVLMLNTRRRLIRVEPLAHGTLDTILVHPREVFRAAIVANAASVILVHNHPSGDPTPSPDDVAVTRAMIEAGRLLDVQVLDHLVIGSGRWVSLKERGLGFGS